MNKGTRDRRQVARSPRGERAALLDHLPPGGGRDDVQGSPTPESGPPPPVDERAGAARGHETRGKVETATMRHLEESEQSPK
jgi:hypothetical protein